MSSDWIWLFVVGWLGIALSAFAVAKIAEARWEQHVDEALSVIEDDEEA